MESLAHVFMAIFGLLLPLGVAGYYFWKNHHTGWVHLRSGPFVERKTQPVLYWGCQISYLAIMAIAVIWISVAAFGFWWTGLAD
ncbi:MAG: hypothetical protein ABL871_15680 [Terricaulis sp.]